MSDTTPAPALPAAPEAVNLLETDAVLVALAHPLRHRLVCSLAHNNRASVNSLAERLREPPDVISKHLRILREARLGLGGLPFTGCRRRARAGFRSRAPARRSGRALIVVTRTRD